ncbi:TM helix containing protein [Vibrio phage Artemius]|nr:TM helix containing protein [Vibrio phage Artemius]
MEKVKSRKLWMTAVLIVGMAGLNYTGSVTSSDLTEFVKWALGIYVAGNVGAKFGKVKE